ncbi:hypothetical protein SUDANB15_07630 (plasmid) [Streptomyces sp. enrichment culture]
MNHATEQHDDEDPDPPRERIGRFTRTVVMAFVVGVATAAGSSSVTLLIQAR